MQALSRPKWAGRAIRAASALAIVGGLYALAGFVAVPRILRAELTGYVASHYHRRLSLGEIRFNPFTLRLDAAGISFPDADSRPMIGAGALHVQLGLASLWRLAPSFREIRLDQPFAHVIVRADGKLNLADLQSPVPPHAPAARSTPMRLYIDRLAVLGGGLVYEDRSHPTPFRTQLESIGFELRDFRTVGTAPNQYALQFAAIHGGQFRGTGAIALAPFASHGSFTVSGLPIRTLWSYLRDQLHFEVASGTLAFNGTYSLRVAGAAPGITLDLPGLSVSDLGIRPLASTRDVVHLGVLAVRATHVDLARRILSIGSIGLTGGSLHAALQPDGRLNLAELVSGPSPSGGAPGAMVSPTSRGMTQPRTGAMTQPPTGAMTQPPTGAMAQPASGAAAAPWSLSAPDISVNGVRLVAEDREMTPAATVTLGDLALHVRDFRHPGAAPVEISVSAAVDRSGRLAAHGTYAPDSGAAGARIALDRIDLTPLQPFLAAMSALTLRSGQLTTKLDVHRSPRGALSVTGTAQVVNLRTVDDQLRRNFVKWKRLTLDGMTYRSQPASLVIRRIVAVAPYARVIVTPQRKLSLFEVFNVTHAGPPAAQSTAPSGARPSARIRGARRVPATTVAETAPGKAASAHSMSIAIGRIDIVNGSAHYTDLWIVPHFFLAIQGLGGKVVGLSSNPRSRATVDLEGKVDRYAPISISGGINPLAATRFTDMKMVFHGVQLTTATPYSARFAGYKIEKGTMSADITYHLERGALSADPHFIIDQLELGEKVASPDAIHLPLKFAVALLKDRHGVIDLNLPISGNMSDPSFRLGPIILKIVVNLLTKAVTSPFALLGKLVGGDEHMQDIDFKPGSAALDAAARKRLAAVAQALAERPGLRLTVPSAYSPALDRPALARDALEQSLLAIGRTPASGRRRAAESQAAPDLEDPATRLRLLVALYRARLGGKAPLPPAVGAVLAAKRGHETPAALGPAVAALQTRLLADTRIPDHDFERLARHRAAAIQGVLLDGTHLDPGRLFILNVGTTPAVDGAVRLKLALE